MSDIGGSGQAVQKWPFLHRPLQETLPCVDEEKVRGAVITFIPFLFVWREEGIGEYVCSCPFFDFLPTLGESIKLLRNIFDPRPENRKLALSCTKLSINFRAF